MNRNKIAPYTQQLIEMLSTSPTRYPAAPNAVLCKEYKQHGNKASARQLRRSQNVARAIQIVSRLLDRLFRGGPVLLFQRVARKGEHAAVKGVGD